MNYMRLKYPDVANGPGVRVSLFVSGCDRHCPGCFNRESWPFDAGERMTYLVYERIYALLDKQEVSGLSILGGEPLAMENLSGVAYLVQAAKHRHPEKSIWIWTGYTYEELCKNMSHRLPVKEQRFLRGVLKDADVLVDGSYIEAERDLTLLFRGSRNQRIIDLQRTSQTGVVQLLGDDSLLLRFDGQKLSEHVRDYIRRAGGTDV